MIRHFTATAFIIDSRKRVLLMWHKKHKKWLPPGGHLDPDEIPEEGAKRECKEETGLDVEIVGLSQEVDLYEKNPEEGRMLKAPIALLLENIPEHPGTGAPAHQHMDFIYLARPINEDQVLDLHQDEGEDLKWFTVDELEKLDTKTEVYANVKGFALQLVRN